MLHQLGHQGISKDAYLKISGKTEDELIEESKPDAAIALRREAVLAAVIEAEKIEPTEAQLLDALEDAATREQTSRQKLLDRLRQAGRVDMLIKEVAAELAIDLVVTTATPVAPETGRQEAGEGAEEGRRGRSKTAARRSRQGRAMDPRRRGAQESSGRRTPSVQAGSRTLRTATGRLVRCPGRSSADDA